MYKYRFISDTYDIDSMLSDIDTKLFKKMRNGYHCINSLWPSNTRKLCYRKDDRAMRAI